MSLDGGVQSLNDFYAQLNKPLVDGFAEADRNGWSELQISLARFMARVRQLDLEAVPPRMGDDVITTLVPKAKAAASTPSLSALYGTDEFPLHTDGAHLERVPDYIVLEATNDESGVPTLLHKIDQSAAYARLGDAISHGMFLIENGASSFYAPVCRRGYRYDPGCMKPADGLAESVAEYFSELRADVTTHEWTSPGKLLIIANRFVVHGRGAASGASGRELKRVMLRKATR